MSLTIFNGSPRGKNSNSSVITNWFLQGYKNNSEVCYLNKVNELPTQTEAFVDADEVLMVFPLYVDGMPGQVKAFFEALLPHKSALEGKKITYIIHSGFSVSSFQIFFISAICSSTVFAQRFLSLLLPFPKK